MDGRQRLKLSLTNRSIGLILPSGGPRAAASPGRNEPTPQERTTSSINDILCRPRPDGSRVPW